MNKRAGFSPAFTMNGFREDVLAGTALSCDQHIHIGGSRLLGLLERVFYKFILRQNRSEAYRFNHVAPKFLWMIEV